MIIGIGTDIIETRRIKEACGKEAFLMRCFTKKEIELIQEDENKAAGNFAVKESVAKAMGTGFRRFSPIHIEVLRDKLGKPYVRLHGEAFTQSNELGISKFHVSISNIKEYATAYVIAEGGGEEVL
jgi:holo-[acyl-carrier-protein] synthase